MMTEALESLQKHCVLKIKKQLPNTIFQKLFLKNFNY